MLVYPYYSLTIKLLLNFHFYINTCNTMKYLKLYYRESMDYESYHYTNSNIMHDTDNKPHHKHAILNQRNQDIFIKGIFLMFLSVVGNFLDTMLPCQTQKLIRRNALMRNIIAFITIYFVIDYTSLKVSNPVEHFKSSVFIYGLFVLFTKSILFFSIMSIVLLSINYVIGNFIKYNNFNHKPTQHLESLEKYINVVIVINIIIGFIHYVYKQLKEQKRFNVFKFIIGDVNCN